MKRRVPIVIAEIGCNHKGNMDIAHEMIKVASSYGKADIIKFQKRTPKELLTPEEYNTPHPNSMHSYGRTYGEHREYLEFDLEQNQQLKEWCEKENVLYATSTWDLTAAKEITKINPSLIKIPSACNLDFEMLEYLTENFHGEIHLSFGMTSHNEEEKIVQFFEKKNRNKDLIIYACTSGYPVPFEDISLLEINRLIERFGNRVKEIGFSGHHLGIAIDIAAFTLGVRYIERHFTLDRTWKGTDHAASLEPDGLRKLVRNLKATSEALTYKNKEILEIEQVQRDKLKRKVKEDIS